MLKALVSLQTRIMSLRSEDGNAAEYGLIVGLVSVVIIGALIALGLALSGVFDDVTGGLGGVAP
jgi:pilus assembly protein Flp/PilA